MRRLVAAGALLAALTVVASAQDKPSVAKYLAEGYRVIHSEVGNPFLQFILQKDATLIWCSVSLQTGETSSCRTIK